MANSKSFWKTLAGKKASSARRSSCKRLVHERLESRKLLASDIAACFAFEPDSLQVKGGAANLPGIQILDQTATEGNAVEFRVVRPDSQTEAVSIKYQIESHTTTDDDLKTTKGGTLRIGKGETEGIIRVPTTADKEAEPTETFRVRLTKATNDAEIADDLAYGTIRDDDSEPTIYIRPTQTTAGEDIEFMVNLSNPFKGGLSVDWETQSGSANAGEHFAAASGKLDFAPFEEYKVIRIPSQFGPNNDAVARDFAIQLASPSAGRFSDSLPGPSVVSASTPGRATAVLKAPNVGPVPFQPEAPQPKNWTPDDPLVGVSGGSEYEGEWKKVEVSLYHAVVNPNGASATWSLASGTANIATDIDSKVWYKKVDPADVAGLDDEPAAGASQTGHSGSIGWAYDDDDSYVFWIWHAIDDIVEPSEDYTFSLTGTMGLKPSGSSFPEIGHLTILESGVVDIDVDSNNNGAVEWLNPDEDSIETTSEKRIFHNTDDDNFNGKKDVDDLNQQYEDSNSYDKNFAGLSTNNMIDGISRFWPDLDGYEFHLFASPQVNLWADTQKESIQSSNWILNNSGTTFIWELGPDSSYYPPGYIYVEGVQQGNAQIIGKLVEVNPKTAKNGVVTSDEVTLTVENLVYPYETQNANWQDQNTLLWKGLDVGEGWHTDTRLVDYILFPNDKGTLATIHPDIPLSGNGPALVASSADGEDSKSQQSYGNGFVMDFDYSFDRSRGVGFGYVPVPSTNKEKLSFVANSGIKFGGKEASILDVKAWVDMNGGLPNFDPDDDDPDDGVPIGDTGIVDYESTTRDYEKEPLGKLMTGVEYYGLQYDEMDDFNFTTPSIDDEFFDGLTDNYNRTNSHMKIDVTKVGTNTYRLKIEVNGAVSYDEQVTMTSLGQIDVQSHWGSGVEFSNMDIQPK